VEAAGATLTAAREARLTFDEVFAALVERFRADRDVRRGAGDPGSARTGEEVAA
jgi:hypothetical protein